MTSRQTFRGVLIAALTLCLITVGLITAGAVGAAPVATTSPTPHRGAGDVVATTDITDRADAKVAGAARVISMTYLSEGADGTLMPVRGTVMIPSAPPRPGGWRVLGYAHGTAGLGDGCAVTHRMGHQGRYDDWLGPWLKDGYVVTATEYAGVGGPGAHAYLDGAVAGKNVLDSVRAARTVVAQRAGRTSTAFVTDGGSQGGHASLWASNIAPSYTPELTQVGGVANSPPIGIADYFGALRPGFPPIAVPDYVTYFSYVLAGLAAARPDMDIDSYLTPVGRRVIAEASTRCYPDQGRATAGMTVGQLIARPLADGPLIPALRAVTDVPTTGYRSPLLIQQGVLDPVAFAPLTARFVTEARANGADIDFRTAPTGHGLGAWAETDALRWANRLGWPAG
ncbi:lipase family protein [Gordonia sp. NPDC003425]